MEPRCKNLECRDLPFGSNPKANVVLCDYSVSLIRKSLGLTVQGLGFGTVLTTVTIDFGYLKAGWNDKEVFSVNERACPVQYAHDLHTPYTSLRLSDEGFRGFNEGPAFRR